MLDDHSKCFKKYITNIDTTQKNYVPTSKNTFNFLKMMHQAFIKNFFKLPYNFAEKNVGSWINKKECPKKVEYLKNKHQQEES